MDINDIKYLSYYTINNYLKKKIILNEDLWLETIIISFLGKNIGIDRTTFIIDLTRNLDILILNKNFDDTDNPDYKNKGVRYKFKLRTLSRLIQKKITILDLETIKYYHMLQ